VNWRNLKIINFEHTLHPRLGLEINNSEFGVWKIVLLAMSCSINADNLIWEQTQNDMSKITLEREREERGETNRVVKINTREHSDLFLEVRF
jgi:hypothetical protein